MKKSTYNVNGISGRLRVLLRVTNLSMMAHPIHLHGHTFTVTEMGAGFLKPVQHLKMNTVNVSAAEVRCMDWVAERPGKWLFHCHFSHHTMNDMHRNPLPTDPWYGRRRDP